VIEIVYVPAVVVLVGRNMNFLFENLVKVVEVERATLIVIESPSSS
jgi:hypothetical protein